MIMKTRINEKKIISFMKISGVYSNMTHPVLFTMKELSK